MTKHRPADESRAIVVAAAEAVIERDGIAAASTRTIAKEAGCTLSTLHYLFPSKEHIFEAVIAEQRKEFEIFGPGDRPDGTLVDRVADILAACAVSALDHPRYYVAQYELMTWALRTAPGEARRSNAAFYVTQYADYLRRAVDLDPRVDLEQLALLVLFQVEGIIVQTVNGVVGSPLSADLLRQVAEGLVGAART